MWAGNRTFALVVWLDTSKPVSLWCPGQHLWSARLAECREKTLSTLSRRGFLAATGAAATAFAVPQSLLAQAMAAPGRPADIPTTLQQTIRIQATPHHKQYRKLVAAPGEAYIPRYDILGKVANPGRTASRRSLVYLGHFTDIHMIDAQTPARVDVMAGQDADLWAGVARPQETMQVNTLTQMTQAMNAAKESPVTGAAMAGAVTTGDNTDQINSKELEWYMGVLDGGTFTPNSGEAGEYQGVQKWPNAFAYHPDDPSQDNYGWYGFPTIPGLLEKAVSQQAVSPGLAVPWFTVFGNHDTLINGVIPADQAFHAYAIGDRKASKWTALAG